MVPQLVEMVAPVEDRVHMVPLPMEEVMVLMAMQVQAKEGSASTQLHENFPKPLGSHIPGVAAEEIMPQPVVTMAQVALVVL